MNSQSSKIFHRGVLAFLLVLLLTFPSRTFFVHAAPGDRTRASVDSSGAQGNGMSRNGQISGDGRFVAFESDATSLPGGTGGLFVKDRQTGATTLLSIDGEKPSISNDGRFVAFESFAANLIGGDTNNVYDIFVYDSQSGVTTRVSVDSGGAQANNESVDVAISSDGRFVTFTSNATNLVSGDTNEAGDVFVHDLQTGATERISIATDGTQANGGSSDASISADGRVVVFSSNATNLVSGDTNSKMDIFARDRQTGITSRVSVNSSGVQADRGANDSSISANGRYVSFSSFSENLMNQAPLEFEHVFVHDRQTGITTLASSYSDGSQMQGRSEASVISADGRYIAFVFDDRGDSQPFLAISIHDSLTGATISAPGGHTQSSFRPSISGDGRYLAYTTAASLVPDDTNGVNDVYVYEISFIPNLTPTVATIQPVCGGGGCSPSASVISFNVTFSEAVTGVTADDFALNITGDISDASVTDISGSGNTYIVNVNTGIGDGALHLDLIDNDSIQDVTLISLGGAGAGNGNFTGQTFTIDKTPPQTTLSLRVDPNPVSADSIHFNVTFSESVNGVDASDFIPVLTGSISGVTVTDVSGAGNIYTVTVNLAAGDGTLRLDVIDNDSIVDAAGNPLGGSGAGNGNFTAGETYIIDKNVPVVISNLRADANPTNADRVRFNLTFSEAVSGVDPGDFILITSGLSSASITGVNGSANTYTITVATGIGNETLRIDLVDNDSIMDIANHPLGGSGNGNGNFTAGETYTINKVTISKVTTDFRSNGSNDGWVLESNENSNLGGSKNSNASVFKLGDDSQNRQFRSVLHFPTYYLPDNAVVTQVILMIKKQDVVGADPFTTHQNISIDIRKGYFSNFNLFSFGSLQLTDFQATADMYSVGVMQNNPVSAWYWGMLDSRAFPYINLTDITQFRIGFQVDDNDDLNEDYVRFYSGDYAEQRDRPHLQIEYYVPK